MNFKCIVALAAALIAGNAAAQSVRDKIGYTELVAELGEPPGGGAATTFLRGADAAWHFRKGLSEASSPPQAWRLAGFAEDASWATGQASIGYGDGDDNTLLADMEGSAGYTTVYLRHEFTLAAGKIPSRLLLRLYADDGAVVWINGTEVARVRAGFGFQAFDATASGAINNPAWEEFLIGNAGSFLVAGSNLLAVHALNQSLTSTDFSIDAELLMPPVTQVESLDDRFDGIEKYLPLGSPNPAPTPGYQFTQVGGNYAGTTVEVLSFPPGAGYGQSPHGANVAMRMFGNATSVAPDITRVRAFESDDWLNGGYLNADLTVAPDAEHGYAQNHSWIATDDAQNRVSYNRALRRLDFACARDNFLPVVGVNYWFPEDPLPPAVPPLLSTAYHVLSVGLSDGRHSRGGTLAGYDGPGRIKPEIVAPESAPSYSTAVTTAAVALLMELATLDPALASALNIEVVKAIVLAGATKDEFPGWTHSPTQPLDAIFGAGELNILNSHRILTGGEQAAVPGAPVDFAGWDFAFVTAGGTRDYTIVVEPNARLVDFSAVVTWHRQFAPAPWLTDFAAEPMLPNLDLALHTASGGVATGNVAASASTIDNVEHIFLPELAAGEYLLRVGGDVLSDLGIAWRARPEALPPQFTIAFDGGGVRVDLGGMVVGVDYTVERSSDLVAWTTVQTVTATGPSAVVIDATGGPRLFYRMRWNLWK